MGRIARRQRAAAAPGARLPRALQPAADRLRRTHARIPGPLWAKNAAVVSAVAIVGLGGVGLGTLGLGDHPAGAQLSVEHASRIRVPPPGGESGGAEPSSQAAYQGASASAAGAAATQAFRRIILPDLLIVAPRGLTRQDLARLRRIAGVRNSISFDGAQITAGGRSVNVIGVDPATFRSWVPLRTASDQAFWAQLNNGEFVAATSTARRLKLQPGARYQLTGATTQPVDYGSAARLRLNDVDLVVNQQVSRKLGLVHQVAALLSAPGTNMSRLQKKVTAILGPGARMESLRSEQLPVSGSGGSGLPTTYIQLFKESAARYCPGLSWTVLAAIGQIESADGQNEGPSSAGALGPMQFEPSTWARWGIDGFGQTGPPNIMNPYDAVPAAARLLCADGAAQGGQSLYNAIFDYNHADWYVREVLGLAQGYAKNYR
ncbi:MAG TPA: lytic transglycosylase domain-containing protein [Streptosporangiaceae bacterium]|nr:lytic transglycosylase domain-containing protein [Streptosporangiaceae bacterium]